MLMIRELSSLNIIFPLNCEIGPKLYRIAASFFGLARVHGKVVFGALAAGGMSTYDVSVMFGGARRSTFLCLFLEPAVYSWV